MAVQRIGAPQSDQHLGHCREHVPYPDVAWAIATDDLSSFSLSRKVATGHRYPSTRHACRAPSFPGTFYASKSCSIAQQPAGEIGFDPPGRGCSRTSRSLLAASWVSVSAWRRHGVHFSWPCARLIRLCLSRGTADPCSGMGWRGARTRMRI
ncbi:hypothetical protein PENSPDRAFT_469654 [Peniophora sp. CONT]|nr:hypothetical protein PENSPDRAFT_469654 [Peniophora sp. CONT]